MKERTQNIAIGLTVIIALCLLGWLIAIFSGRPTILQRGYTVIIHMPTTADIQVGNAVHIAGINIGKVSNASFIDPKNVTRGVAIELKIGYDTDLPINTVAKIFKRNFVGSAYVQLEAQGDIPVNPKTGKQISLSKHDSPVIPGYIVTSSIIPDDMQDSFKNITDLAKTLNEMLAGQPSSQTPATSASQPNGDQPPSLKKSLQNLDKTLAGMAEIFGNEENLRNINDSFTNIREVTAQAKEVITAIRDFSQQAQKAAEAFTKASDKTSAKADELITKLIDDAQHVSQLLATLTKVSQRLESGQGSAGKLMNDPELYNNLVTATKQLSNLLQQLQDLADQWRQKGVKLDM